MPNREEILMQALQIESRALAAQAAKVATPGTGRYWREMRRLYEGAEPHLTTTPFAGLAEALKR